jgi:hypothetical protein
MTEQTATDLLTYLVTTFLNNGFSEIGTFLLPEYRTENQYEQDTTAYQYRDSSTALQDLLADRNTRPKEALRLLLAAAQQYFNLAAAIPNAYAAAIAVFDSTDRPQIDPTIRLVGRDQQSVTNVSAVLANSQMRQMQRLLGILGERIGEEDDSFLNDLDDL